MSYRRPVTPVPVCGYTHTALYVMYIVVGGRAQCVGARDADAGEARAKGPARAEPDRGLFGEIV